MLYSKKKMIHTAQQWAQLDATVEARILEDREWSINTPEEKLNFFCSCYYYHLAVRRCNERTLVLPYYLANWMNNNSSIIAAVPHARDDLQRMHEHGECFNIGHNDSKLFQAARKEIQGRPQSS